MEPIELKRGSIVRIYQDPLTRRTPEGYATLVRFLGKPDEGLERWTVKFDKWDIVDRTISVEAEV